jgi:PKD repeat protein
LIALVSGVLALTPAVACGETYGELGHFGSSGSGRGQFKLVGPPSLGTHAFGVDPTDNSVYVGDEPEKREYRIQKFTAGGEYLGATPHLRPPNRDGIEGIAVDPTEKRVYVLALEKRSESAPIDPSQPASGTLYAFSTEPSGEVLMPAAGTVEGVLTGPTTFGSQSNVPEEALLDPRGITVDPTTHDVIVLGEVDPGVLKEGEEPHLHVSLERVHANGTLGARYVNSTGFFSEGNEPNSPVISQTGKVYVQQNNRIVQIPSNFASANPSMPFFHFETEGPLQEKLLEFDSSISEHPAEGGGLSFVPEGTSEGTIYAVARIREEANERVGAQFPGALAFKYIEHGEVAEASELGWTGGQTKKLGNESCAIGFGGVTYPSVAAGKDRVVFMLYTDLKSARVVEFGPDGKGCPTAEATEPTATVNGQPLSSSNTVSTGTPIRFSSTVTQANALSVEWSFGDGQTKTESADEHQHTEVTHTFVRGGTLTVTETIYTDNLATPTILKTIKVSVSATAPPPTAVLEGPSDVTIGGGATLGRLVYLGDGGMDLEEAALSEEAIFDASASFASTETGPNRIETYHWIFGDGESETTASATATHRYEKASVYKVELTVTDTLGSTSVASTLAVKVNEPAAATPKDPESIGGASGTPPAGTPATTTGSSSTPAGSPRQSPVPDAHLASTSLAVSSSGAVKLDVTCPPGESSCAGTVALRTLGTVSTDAARGKKHKAGVLMLATGRFKVAGGRQKSVKLSLSAKARVLLAHAHVLHVQALIVASDLAGEKHTTQTNVTLYAHRATRRGKG